MLPRLSRTDLWVSVLLVLACTWIVLTVAGKGARVATASDQPARAELNVASLMVDDGFYYLKISENLANGFGSTFDGLHVTNGYHPLWLLALVPVHWLADGRGEALLLAFALQALLMIGTALLLYRVARLGMAPPASLAAVLTWLVLQCGYWPSLSGMEFALQSFLIGLLLLESARLATSGEVARVSGVRLSVLLSLAFLARLDNGLLGALLLISLARAVPQIRSQLRAAATILGCTVLAYGSLNLALFGSILPVSGPLKLDWSLKLLARDVVYMEYGWIAAKIAYLKWPLEHWPGTEAGLFLLGTVGACLALGTALIRPGRRLIGESLARVLSPFAVFGVLQVAFYVVVYHGGYSFQPWYFAVQGVLAGVMAGVLVERTGRWVQSSRRARVLRPIRTVLVAGFLLALCARLGWSVERKRKVQSGFSDGPLYSVARWVDEHLPPKTKIGAWNAGILAYFSDARVVNLDGLVNSANYRHRRHDLCRYWREEDIGHLADVFNRQDPFSLFAEQAHGCLEDLELVWEGPTYPGSVNGSAVYRIAADRPRESSVSRLRR